MNHKVYFLGALLLGLLLTVATLIGLGPNRPDANLRARYDPSTGQIIDSAQQSRSSPIAVSQPSNPEISATSPNTSAVVSPQPPAPAGPAVDPANSGPTAANTIAKANQRVLFERVLFEPGKAELSKEQRAKLERLAKTFKNTNQGSLTVQGFHGAVKDIAAGERVAKKRAQIVASILREQGVDKSRIKILKVASGGGSGPEGRRVEVKQAN